MAHRGPPVSLTAAEHDIIRRATKVEERHVKEPKTAAPVQYRLTPAELDAEMEKWTRFIHKIAGWWKQRNQKVDYDDLVQEVAAGFVYAGRFMYDKRGKKMPDGSWQPIRFQTYAKYWGDLYARTYVLTAKASGFKVPNLQNNGFHETYEPQSLNHEGNGDRDGGLLGSLFARDTSAELSPERLWGRLKAALTPIRFKVVQLRFLGSDDEKPMTLECVGDIIGLSKERVRQILREALDQLREQPELFEL